MGVGVISDEENMLLNVKMLHDNNRNCFQDIVATMAFYLNRRYELIFLNSLYFSFDKHVFDCTSSLGKALSNIQNIESNQAEMSKLLADHHGMQTDVYAGIEFNEAAQLIKENIYKFKIPVVLSMDCFWVPHNPNYQDIHSWHPIIINGFCEDFQSFYFTDPYFGKKDMILPKDHIMEGFLKKAIVYKKTKEQYHNMDWKCYITKSINKLYSKSNTLDAFQQMELFADCIENSNTFKNEAEESDVKHFWLIPLFTNLRDIAFGRKLYANFLAFISEIADNELLSYYALKVKSLGEEWDVIRGIVTKGLISSNDEIIKRKIPNLIRKLANKELQIANELCELCSGNNTLSGVNYNKDGNKNDIPSFNSIKKVECIDIYGHCNNNAIYSSISKDSIADLTGTGIYMLADSFTDGESIEVDKLKYKLCEIDDKKNDNLTCMNQTIEVDKMDFNCISLLGGSAYGSSADIMNVYYEDGTNEEIKIGFTEFVFEPEFGEIIAKKVKAAEKFDDKAIDYHTTLNLFAKVYRLNKGTNIKSLKLPFVPNMHIFAITLAKIDN